MVTHYCWRHWLLLMEVKTRHWDPSIRLRRVPSAWYWCWVVHSNYLSMANCSNWCKVCILTVWTGWKLWICQLTTRIKTPERGLAPGVASCVILIANANCQAHSDEAHFGLRLVCVQVILQLFIKYDENCNMIWLAIRIVDDILCTGVDDDIQSLFTSLVVIQLVTITSRPAKLRFFQMTVLQHDGYTCHWTRLWAELGQQHHRCVHFTQVGFRKACLNAGLYIGFVDQIAFVSQKIWHSGLFFTPSPCSRTKSYLSLICRGGL